MNPAADYQVALDVFEGPLDLLLHLVKKHELPILDIPIAFALNAMQRSCAALRRAYPIGHTLRARADEGGLALTLVHGTLRVPWTDYEAHRLRERTVELRTRKGRPLSNLTLPAALFTPEALRVLRSAVPKSF